MRIETKAELISTITNIMSAVGENGEMTAIVESDKITFNAIDPSHVRAGTIVVKKENFDTAELPVEKENVYIDIKQLKSALQSCSSSDLLTLEVQKGRLIFQAGIVSKTLTLLENSTSSILKLEPKNTITVLKDFLNKGLTASKDVSEAVTLILTDMGFMMRSKNAKGEKADAVVPKDLLTKMTMEEPSTVSINLELLQKIIRIIPSDKVTLKMQTEYPLAIIFDVDDIKKIEANIIIAPIMLSPEMKPDGVE